MSRLRLLLGIVPCLAAPSFAQSMPGMDMKGMAMPGMAMPAPSKPPAHKRKAAPAKAQPHHATPHDHGEMAMPPGHDMSSMPGMDMPKTPAAHDMATMDGTAMAGTALQAGSSLPPPPPMDHYADRFYAPADMERSRRQMMREDGAALQHQLLFNIAEIQAQSGHDGYRWDAEGFIGGDINRLWIKSEGEGRFREGVDHAEVQALYGRAIGPYYNLQLGVRQDIRPSPSRTYATIGIEGLSPYRFETEAALFVSTRGDVLGRIEALYDQRITQRLILQPRVELNLSAQDVPQDRYGAGLVDAELGLRLRYEVRREFAPYVGLSWDRKAGKSADYARADGDKASSTSFVVGVRGWF
jgi:copper resistance protein B